MRIRTLAVLLLFSLCGCSSATPLMKHERTYEKTISLDGIPRDQIFDRSLEWLTRNVAEGAATADRTKGIISCSGKMVRPFSSVNITGAGNLTYLARETILEEGMILSFELQSVVESRSYSSVTYFSQGGIFPVVQADLGGARKTFDALADSLRKYLLSNPANDLK